MAKKSNRENTKYPGLEKKVHPRVREEFLDQDYLHKLSDKEKQWLSNFNEEYVGASFTHKGRIFHKSKKSKRECYNRNNARNRDLYAIAKVNGLLESTENIIKMINESYDCNKNATEDAVIAAIDSTINPIPEQETKLSQPKSKAVKNRKKRRRKRK